MKQSIVTRFKEQKSSLSWIHGKCLSLEMPQSFWPSFQTLALHIQTKDLPCLCCLSFQIKPGPAELDGKLPTELKKYESKLRPKMGPSKADHLNFELPDLIC